MNYQKANYYGSLLEASTISIGKGDQGEVFVPFRDILPMVNPNDIIFDGSDFLWMNDEIFFKWNDWPC